MGTFVGRSGEGGVRPIRHAEDLVNSVLRSLEATGCDATRLYLSRKGGKLGIQGELHSWNDAVLADFKEFNAAHLSAALMDEIGRKLQD